MDKIIFPNGTSDIVTITFPNKEKLVFTDMLKCSKCNEQFTAQRVFQQHKDWAETNPNIIFNPTSLTDFLHRTCPKCGVACRINKIAKAKTRGGYMPNAADTMEIKMSGEEITELEKAGDVLGTFIGPGEIVEFDDKVKVDADGNPLKVKKMKLIVNLNGEERGWLPNYTSMKALIAMYGQHTEAWEGKQVQLSAVKQNIAGQMKMVVYAQPVKE